MTKWIDLEIAPFVTHCSLKAQGKKVLEEAAELYAEVEHLHKNPDSLTCWIEDEAADLITAVVNLVWLVCRKANKEYTEEDAAEVLNKALMLCYGRNKNRGRYRERDS